MPISNAGTEGSTGPVSILRRFWWMLAAGLLTGALLGYGLAGLMEPRYDTQMELLLADPREGGVFRDIGTAGDAGRYLRNEARRVTSSAVASQARERLGGRLSVRQIQERLTAEPSPDTDIIIVSAWDRTAEGAVELAEAIAAAYEAHVLFEVQANAEASLEELEEQQAALQQSITTAEQLLAANPENAVAEAERDAAVGQLITVQGLIDRIQVDVALYRSGVDILESPEPPAIPTQPRPLVMAFIGAVLGLLAASGLATRYARMAQLAEVPEDPRVILKTPLLGAIPRFRKEQLDGVPTLAMRDPYAPHAEAYRFLSTAVDHTLAGLPGVEVLAVTSARPGDGKTETVLNLGAAAAADGRRVVVIDCDVRMRGLTREAGMNTLWGLSDLAMRDSDVRNCVHRWPTIDVQTLAVCPAGQIDVDPGTFFRSKKFTAALKTLRQWGDLIILDTPPVLAVAESWAIAGQAEGVVLVVTHGTPLRLIRDVQARLELLGTPTLGYVYNRAPSRLINYGNYEYGAGGQRRMDSGRQRRLARLERRWG